MALLGYKEGKLSGRNLPSLNNFWLEFMEIQHILVAIIRTNTSSPGNSKSGIYKGLYRGLGWADAGLGIGIGVGFI